MPATLTVVINAQDVEKDLPRAIISVKDLADEIVVIDQSSVDNTAKVAKKHGAKVFEYGRVGYVELARNFAISKARSEWVLILDPDEEVTKSLALKVREVINANDTDYCRIPRKNIIFGKWLRYSRWWPDYNIRLFKKGYVSWNELIHSVPMTQGRGSDLGDEEKYAIIHHNYNSIGDYIERMNRYTSQQAKLKVSENYEFVWKDILLRPANEFLSRYFYGEGYKDGLHGLAVSLLQGFSEAVVYLKIWETENFKEQPVELKDAVLQMRSIEKDFHYWQNDSLVNKHNDLAARIKRKLRI